MGYVIVGFICLSVGACIGVFTMALVSISRSTESEQLKEDAGREDR